MHTATEFSLHFNPSLGTIRLDTQKDGVHASKNISYEVMLECVKGSIERDAIKSGLLPPGCISFQAGAGGRYVTTILHPERRADVVYEGTEYKDFPLPRLVFKFEHQEGARIMRSWMGVVGTGQLTPKTPMYHYPFSNVSGNYHLCTGSNPLPKCKSLHTLGSLPYYIISMPNNNDHFTSSRNKPKLEMRDLMELLRDKDPDYYYSDILIPEKKTIMDFINAN